MVVEGGAVMLRKVIYPGGTSSMVNFSKIYGLMKSDKIIAFYCSEGWVEVRRKSKSTYNGVDRRQTNPDRFYAGFQL